MNDLVDIVQGLQDIKTKVEGNNDEFTFETDIAALLGKAHDGHFCQPIKYVLSGFVRRTGLFGPIGHRQLPSSASSGLDRAMQAFGCFQ